MARRRGFFAELQHQAAVAERNRQRAAAADFRLHQQRQREAERLAAAWRRAQDQAARDEARDRAAAEKESQRLYAESRSAEAEALTAEAEMRLREIDDILRATLDVDDYVDLETLRSVAQHPPFESLHATPAPAPCRLEPGPLPTYYPPPGKGPRKGKRARDSAQADRTYMISLYALWDALPAVEQTNRARFDDHTRQEQHRLEQLAVDRSTYDRECAERNAEAARHNADLDALISGFAAGDESAITEYFGIVLENSAYPEGFEVGYDLRTDAPSRELSVDLRIPCPDDLPVEKAWKYVKARDELTPVNQTQSERRQRYAAALHNVAVRTIHELWEADRTRSVETISLTAGVTHIDPATGRSTTTSLLAVAVARDEFETLVLDRVDAGASLQHLGAVVSRSPATLAPISTSAGVRTR